jgi:hypothetical protein
VDFAGKALPSERSELTPGATRVAAALRSPAATVILHPIHSRCVRWRHASASPEEACSIISELPTLIGRSIVARGSTSDVELPPSNSTLLQSSAFRKLASLASIECARSRALR